jgi:hypothetical protein
MPTSHTLEAHGPQCSAGGMNQLTAIVSVKTSWVYVQRFQQLNEDCHGQKRSPARETLWRGFARCRSQETQSSD